MKIASARRRADAGGRGLVGVVLAALLANAGPAAAEAPAVDLVVEVRRVDEAALADAAAGGYTVSTRGAAAARPRLQSLRVRNGEWGALRWTESVPVQWVSASGLRGAAAPSGAPARAATAAAPAAASAAGAARRGGVVQSVTWIEAGQALAVRPRWSGAGTSVTLDIDVDDAQIEEVPGGGLPTTHRQQGQTRLTLPFDQWVRFAAVGDDDGSRPAASVWSTRDAAPAAAQALQVRVRHP